MNTSIIRGLCFGLTSAVITTLGLMIGLFSASATRSIIIVGILTIAIADSLSDAFGMHVSEESFVKSHKNVWKATGATFFTKFFFALTFIIPILFFDLDKAVLINIIYGLILLVVFNYHLAKLRKINVYKTILEHISIAIVVIISTYFIGKII